MEMETPIIVALIGLVGSVVAVLGSIGVSILNNHLKGRVNGQENRIEILYALAMSDDLFRQLEKLSTGSYGPYWIDDERKYGLAAELNYLKMLGYIKFDQDPNVSDLRELPIGDNPELSQYISVTQQGRDFIALRKRGIQKV